jgi:tartrate-resistant acid phosphatase type 5
MKTLAISILTLLSTLAFADLNVVAIGDTGKGNDMQFKVAESLHQKCKQLSCSLALLLGDNVYDEGITSPTDSQMIEKFEKPYAHFPAPFYVALGNHDYGKLANQWERGGYQIDYARSNPNYILPAAYYTFVEDDVRFIVLDTSQLFHDHNTDKQRDFIRKTLEQNTSRWVVAMGHHPFISNGPHGNAGKYDGVPFPPYSGSVIKKLFERELCGKIDVYISGHDHSLQTMPGPSSCARPLFIVSGGGASASKLVGDNPVHFAVASAGFTALQFRGSTLQVSHFNDSGQLLHTYSHQKPKSFWRKVQDLFRDAD